MELNKIHVGDALTLARQLEDNSIHCIITSPAYWGLRDYGTAEWLGGDADCDHKPQQKWIDDSGGLGERQSVINANIAKAEFRRGFKCPCGAVRIDQQMGLEPTINEHIGRLVELFRELRRALHPSGTLRLNYGDCYATTTNGRSAADTKAVGNDDRTFRDKPFSTVGELPAKNLVGMAWRVALALQDDGWILRSDIIWHKVNPMPESVKDRPTRAHEYLFLFSKEPRYYYDAEAIREKGEGYGRSERFRSDKYTNNAAFDNNRQWESSKGGGKNSFDGSGRNRRTVWSIPSAPFPEAHFATFPPKLVAPCILAGTSEHGVCPHCLNPWRRIVEPSPEYANHLGKDWADYDKDQAEGRGHFEANGNKYNSTPTKRGDTKTASYITVGWEPTCDCPDNEPIPAVALDPFIGSGTVAQVAIENRRSWLGFELNPDYAEMAMRRIASLQVKLF